MKGLQISHFSRRLAGKQCVTVFDEEGPILIKSVNISLPPYGPAVAQAQRIMVFIDDNNIPIVNVPVLDFAGLTHGRISSMVTHYTECSGSTVTLRWPISAKGRMKIVLINEDNDSVPLAVLVAYRKCWSGNYISAVLSHCEPGIGDRVSVKLPTGSTSLLGLVVAVHPSDLEWCGEGKVFLGNQVLADGLDMLGGTCLDTTQWFGRDRGISVSVKFGPNVRGHEFLGVYRWFPGGLDINGDTRLEIEQMGRHVLVKKGTVESKRIPRSDKWDILLVTAQQTIPDVREYDYSLTEVDDHLGYRDYEESSFRDHLWSTIREHMKPGERNHD